MTLITIKEVAIRPLALTRPSILVYPRPLGFEPELDAILTKSL